MIKIAFDIDDSLYKVEEYYKNNVISEQNKRFRQVPDYDLISVLK